MTNCDAVKIKSIFPYLISHKCIWFPSKPHYMQSISYMMLLLSLVAAKYPANSLSVVLGCSSCIQKLDHFIEILEHINRENDSAFKLWFLYLKGWKRRDLDHFIDDFGAHWQGKWQWQAIFSWISSAWVSHREQTLKAVSSLSHA